MGTKSRETLYGPSIRAAGERAEAARKEADKLAVEAWNKRMLVIPARLRPWATRNAGEDILGSNRLKVFHLAAVAPLWGQRSFCPTRGYGPWSEH